MQELVTGARIHAGATQKNYAGHNAGCVKAVSGCVRTIRSKHSDSHWVGRASAGRQAGPDGQGQASDDRPAQLSTLETEEAGEREGRAGSKPGPRDTDACGLPGESKGGRAPRTAPLARPRTQGK